MANLGVNTKQMRSYVAAVQSPSICQMDDGGTFDGELKKYIDDQRQPSPEYPDDAAKLRKRLEKMEELFALCKVGPGFEGSISNTDPSNGMSTLESHVRERLECLIKRKTDLKEREADQLLDEYSSKAWHQSLFTAAARESLAT
jgi:hypothetical protein